MRYSYINLKYVTRVEIEDTYECKLFQWRKGMVSENPSFFSKSTVLTEEGYYYYDGALIKDVKKWQEENSTRYIIIGENDDIKCLYKSRVIVHLCKDDTQYYYFDNIEQSEKFADLIFYKIRNNDKTVKISTDNGIISCK